MRRLRVARRRVALTAALAELAGAWNLEQQMAALTRFAETAIDVALRLLLRTTPGAALPPGRLKRQRCGQPAQDFLSPPGFSDIRDCPNELATAGAAG